MFFILSKLLQFIINPVLWVVVLLFFSLFGKDEKFKKRYLTFALGLILFFSNAFIIDEFARAWEIPATRYESLKKYDAGIVLGGMMQYDKEYDRLQFYRGIDRLLQAVELYKRGVIKKIIFTGGSGIVLHPEKKEGPLVARYLLTLGVPEKDFLIESESNNTHENAVFTKAMLDKENLRGDFLLITSAFHMRRSLGCFKKAGIHAESYSVDRYSGPRKFEIDHLFIPDISAFYNSSNLVHEIVGFITYKIVGYS